MRRQCSPPALVAWASMRRPRFYVRRDNVQPVPSALVRAARRPREFSMHASSYRCLGTLLAFLRGDCWFVHDTRRGLRFGRALSRRIKLVRVHFAAAVTVISRVTRMGQGISIVYY